jgi:CheY-like chemotaxis protein
MVMVEVIDDGIGISEEMQQTLFKPFKQAMRRAGGTGLGIYSLSKRVESLGGTCGVSSRADGRSGARFWFTLPYRPDHTVTMANLETAEDVSTMQLTESTSYRRSIENFGPPIPSSMCDVTMQVMPAEAVSLINTEIMLVEDSALIQKTCARSFLREGIVVDIANNGLECVEKVLRAPKQFKVLLMDVNMPLMDGLQATERIRQWERDLSSGGEREGTGHLLLEDKKLLIIGVSANSDSVSAQEALDAGMDRFISKPLKMSVLRECLADFDMQLENFKNVLEP